METSQLIKALADAANAAKPPQEYCLFWIDWWPLCMTKAEWSGWMQVIGALSALGIAIALPYWQKRVADRESFNRARQCLLMLCAMVDSMRLIAAAAVDTRSRALSAAVDLSANLAAMFDEVRPPQMSLGQLAIWRAARAAVSQLGELSSNIREGRIADENVVLELDDLMHDCKQLLEGFGVKAEREPATK